MINNSNIDKILNTLKKKIKDFDEPAIKKVSQKYRSKFYILIATLLSARTRDETTIKVCNNLFKIIKNNNDLINIDQKKLEKLIYPVGFYITKSKHLKQLALILKKRFNNKIPDTLENMLILPGVGRKTANLVIILGFDKYGICVDTHVHRIVNRWNYVNTKNPDQTELELRKKLPKKHWKIINDILVSYGKIICKPINPQCQKCKISKYCNFKKQLSSF